MGLYAPSEYTNKLSQSMIQQFFARFIKTAFFCFDIIHSEKEIIDHEKSHY